MSKKRQWSIEKESKAMRLLKQASAFKGAQEVNEQDSFPNLHHFAECFAIRARVAKSFMKSKGIS